MTSRNIVRTVYKVSDFISWQRNESLVLSPSFQRRSVWSSSAKSYLIDTIVRGFPIPIIFLREQTNLNSLEPKREVVDGQQRLRTLFSFIEPALLKDYDYSKDFFQVLKSHNKGISKKDFSQLNQKVKQAIVNYEFSAHILPSDTEDTEVLQIFARMNSTGVKLNHQEIRNAEFFGEFKQQAYRLAYEQIDRWRDWNIFSENQIARMNEVEETSDLMILIMQGIHRKSQPAISKAYSNGEENFEKAKTIDSRFSTVMDTIKKSVGDIIGNSEFSRVPLFHTLFTVYYDKLFGLTSPLVRAKPKTIPSIAKKAILNASNKITKKQLPKDLLKDIGGGTTNLKSRATRYTFLLREFENAKK